MERAAAAAALVMASRAEQMRELLVEVSKRLAAVRTREACRWRRTVEVCPRPDHPHPRPGPPNPSHRRRRRATIRRALATRSLRVCEHSTRSNTRRPCCEGGCSDGFLSGTRRRDDCTVYTCRL